MKKYLIVIYGDVSIMTVGPFVDEEARTRSAARHRKNNGDKDGLFRLDVLVDGSPRASDFSGKELS